MAEQVSWVEEIVAISLDTHFELAAVEAASFRIKAADPRSRMSVDLLVHPPSLHDWPTVGYRREPSGLVPQLPDRG